MKTSNPHERAELLLLRDLVRLVDKHGPESLSRVAHLLRDPEALQTAKAILEAEARARKKARDSARRGDPTDPVEMFRRNPPSTLQGWTEVILGKPPGDSD